MITRTTIAILAKAPIPGRAKTRLIPAIGAHAAAVLQERMTAQTVETALAAGIGPVTLWCAPDLRHASFRELALRHHVTLRCQPDGNLGVRMLAPLAARNGPTLVIGTDCPARTAEHLQQAAQTHGAAAREPCLQGADILGDLRRQPLQRLLLWQHLARLLEGLGDWSSLDPELRYWMLLGLAAIGLLFLFRRK